MTRPTRSQLAAERDRLYQLAADIDSSDPHGARAAEVAAQRIDRALKAQADARTGQQTDDDQTEEASS